MKSALKVGLLLSVSFCSAADFKQIESLYQSVLSSNDDSALPSAKQLHSPDIEDGIKTLPPAEVEVLLPLAKQCWQSPRKHVREAGFSLLFVVSLRLDSTKLLEPYLDDLGGLLTSSDGGDRSAVIYVLGATNPAPTQKALAYLSAHLDYPNNSSEELRMTAAGLLRPGLSDIATIRHVLTAARQHSELKISADVIGILGLRRITTPDSLEFIRAGLSGSDQFVRQASIDAVGRLPKGIRNDFARDLLRIANDPSETNAIRSSAATILVSVK